MASENGGSVFIADGIDLSLKKSIFIVLFSDFGIKFLNFDTSSILYRQQRDLYK